MFSTFLFAQDKTELSIYNQLQEILKSGISCEIILVDGKRISAYQIIKISENEITLNILHDKRLGYNRDIISMADYHNNDKAPKLLRTIEIAHIQSIKKLPSFYENPINVITVLLSTLLILMYIKYIN